MSMKLERMFSLSALALATSMNAVIAFAPPLGGTKTPTFLAGTTYRDGLGRRKKIPVHPKHNSRRGIMSKREFRDSVLATHSDKPDPRDGKYLNNFASRMRVRYPEQSARELFA